MNKRIPLFLIVFLVSIFSALSSYEHLGGNDRDFYGGTTYIGINNLSGYSATPSATTTITFPPLVADLDSDGENEVIVISHNSLYIYSSNLILLDSLTSIKNSFGDTYLYLSALDISDIDSDGYKEIILGSSAENGAGIGMGASILEFRGTSINQQFNFTEAGSGADDELYIETIGETGAFLTSYSTVHAFNSALKIKFFNSTYNATSYQFVFEATGNDIYCLPQSGMTIADYDNDGNYEWLVSVLHTSDSTVEKAEIYIFQPLTNLSVYSAEKTIIENLAEYSNSDSCIDSEREDLWITKPIIADIDGNPGNEIIVGVKYDVNDFRILIFNNDGTLLDMYPNYLTGSALDGDYILNIYLSDYYGTKQGVCMDIYDNSNSELNTICGTNFVSGGITGTNNDDSYSTSISYNITANYSLTSHSIRWGSNSGLYDLNAYGILKDNTDNTITTSWQNPRGDSIMIPADVDEDGYSDFAIYDKPTLYLYTTSPYNYGCNEQPESPFSCYETITIEPAITSSWCGNTSPRVTVVFNDYDNSPMQANVEFYEYDSNSQNTTWQGNFSDSESHTFMTDHQGLAFITNKTGAYRVTIKIRDFFKPTQVNTITRSFTVANIDSCARVEDGTQTTIGAPAEGDTAIVTPTDKTNNIIKNGLDTFTDNFGIGTSILWLLITAAGAVIIFLQVREINFKFGLLMLEVSGMTVLGYALGFISFIYIVLMLIVGFIVIAVTFSKLFTGNSGGG